MHDTITRWFAAHKMLHTYFTQLIWENVITFFFLRNFMFKSKVTDTPIQYVHVATWLNKKQSIMQKTLICLWHFHTKYWGHKWLNFTYLPQTFYILPQVFYFDTLKINAIYSRRDIKSYFWRKLCLYMKWVKKKIALARYVLLERGRGGGRGERVCNTRMLRFQVLCGIVRWQHRFRRERGWPVKRARTCTCIGLRLPSCDQHNGSLANTTHWTTDHN